MTLIQRIISYGIKDKIMKLIMTSIKGLLFTKKKIRIDNDVKIFFFKNFK